MKLVFISLRSAVCVELAIFVRLVSSQWRWRAAARPGLSCHLLLPLSAQWGVARPKLTMQDVPEGKDRR
jgi:hypothetical protein